MFGIKTQVSFSRQMYSLSFICLIPDVFNLEEASYTESKSKDNIIILNANVLHVCVHYFNDLDKDQEQTSAFFRCYHFIVTMY